MEKNNVQMSESYLVGMLLALAGGFMDVYSYICRGHVFANAQTGNIVLLGIKLAEKKWLDAAFYIIPILSFFIGIIFAEAIKAKFQTNRMVHWRQIIIVIEILVLLAVGLIPSGTYNTLANCLVSFVCSLQVQSFRKVNGNAYVTTMCTGNLRSATEHLYKYKITKDKSALRSSIQYFVIILVFICGAAAATVMTGIFSSYAVWFACIVLFVVFILMIYKPDTK